MALRFEASVNGGWVGTIHKNSKDQREGEGDADFSLDIFNSCGQKVTQVEIFSRQ